MKNIKAWFKKNKKWVKIVYNIFLYAFAIAGFLIIGAWSFYQLGLTNDRGSIDKNNRYLAQVAQIEKEGQGSKERINKNMSESLLKLSAISKFYPKNAQLIMEGISSSEGNANILSMISACEIALKENKEYQDFLLKAEPFIKGIKSDIKEENAIEWMNLPEWEALKAAIVKDKALIDSAAKVTGVEPRLIVGCLVGEQIRLFNSKREMYKKYLGPVKVLSVQSQFSLGVNGIKDFTAMQVEENLKNPNSLFYMGKRFENILDFSTQDKATERVNRLVDYKNHYYSYVYTGCILHQTKNQWQRAGYSIENRPDILFTLFNIGFSESKPSSNPQCGGSHIAVGDKTYTFGAIGFDFYYSGELTKEFPYIRERFSK